MTDGHADALVQWQRQLPATIRDCCVAWQLTPGEAFATGAGGHALPVVRADGSSAVLKLIFPHRESEHEADALAVWQGNGAVRLLERNPAHNAILIERCRPGMPLSTVSAEAALDVFAQLLPRLWLPATAPFRTLSDEAAWWLDHLEQEWIDYGKPFERRILERAMEILATLPADQGESVLLNQDLHDENVLAAQRRPWLVIDPKPLAGEREFGLAPILRSVAIRHGRRQMRLCVDRLSEELRLNRERVRLWAVAQTVAWSFDAIHQTEAARWLLEDVTL